jgi:hypothetical protein
VGSDAAGRISDEIGVRAGRKALVATGPRIVVGGVTFDLDQVDRVTYKAAARVNRASHVIGLAQGGVKHVFMFDAYRRGSELFDWRETWERPAALPENTACPRVARSAVAPISAAETVVFDAPPANRIEADAAGLRARRPFARTLPWSDVAGARLREGQIRLLTAGERAAGTEEKPRIDSSDWKAVILPRVVAAAFATRWAKAR